MIDQYRAEAIALVMQLPPHARKVWLWLGRLYLEREVKPSPTVDAEILMIETAIENGYADELSPPLMTLQ